VVLVTHDQRTATALGDRIAVLGDGTVEQVGPPSEVLGRPESRFVAEFTGNENVFEAEVVGRSKGVVELRTGDVTLTANAERTGGSASTADPGDGSVVTACVHPSRVRVRPPSADAATGDENLVRGTVRRWLNEGDEYRMVVGVDGGSLDLTAAVPPPVFERLSVEQGTNIDVAVSPGAIHLIPTAEDGA
jgi:molybdate/tungstate transport system ATP-binding protein